MFDHFIAAQEPVYAQALAELRAGRKQSHWMWFIFPQIAGLGNSAMAQRFALANLAEAQAYLAHPVLGPRLRECTQAILQHAPGTARPRALDAILGYPDDLKFHSAMTLFNRAAPDELLFAQALDAFCGGRRDAATLARL